MVDGLVETGPDGLGRAALVRARPPARRGRPMVEGKTEEGTHVLAVGRGEDPVRIGLLEPGDQPLGQLVRPGAAGMRELRTGRRVVEALQADRQADDGVREPDVIDVGPGLLDGCAQFPRDDAQIDVGQVAAHLLGAADGDVHRVVDELAEQPPQVELVADELDAGPGGLQQEPVLRRPGDQALERGPGARLTEITVAHDVVDIGDRGIEEIQQNAFLVPEFRTQQGIPGDQVVVDGAVQQVPLRGRLDDIRLGHAVDPRDAVAQGPGTDSQQISQFTARDDVVELAEQFDEKRLTLGEKNHL